MTARSALALVVLVWSASFAWAERLVPFAGGGDGKDNVPATEAKMTQPFGVDFDSEGNAYLVELAGQRVLRVDTKGTFSIVAGTGKKGDSGDGQDPKKATFNGMHALALDRGAKVVYLADTWNGRVRKYDIVAKSLAGFAGQSYPAGKKANLYAGDGGPASGAWFSGIYCIALDPACAKLYVTDLENRRIRVVTLATGQVDLVAGNGKSGKPADGSDAKTSPLVDPRACVADRHGNVYILERGGHALRVVDPSGKIRTVVGTGKAGLAGDGGPAIQAQLNGPKHLCIDRDDSVIIADTANHVIRRYTPADGKIVRLAGTGKKGDSGKGGPALETPMNEPHGVTIHPTTGALYIVDSMNHRVFRMEK